MGPSEPVSLFKSKGWQPLWDQQEPHLRTKAIRQEASLIQGMVSLVCYSGLNRLDKAILWGVQPTDSCVNPTQECQEQRGPPWPSHTDT